MSTRSYLMMLAILATSMVVIAGCKPVDTAQELVVTFNGEDCRYEGPDSVYEGTHAISLNNETEMHVSLGVLKLDEGRSWQDVVDYYASGAIDYASWMSSTMTGPSQDDPDAREYSLSEGLHAIMCWTLIPQAVMPVAALDVKSE